MRSFVNFFLKWISYINYVIDNKNINFFDCFEDFRCKMFKISGKTPEQFPRRRRWTTLNQCTVNCSCYILRFFTCFGIFYNSEKCQQR